MGTLALTGRSIFEHMKALLYGEDVYQMEGTLEHEANQRAFDDVMKFAQKYRFRTHKGGESK